MVHPTAYFAGIFDGEGTVFIAQPVSGKDGKRRHILQVAVGMKDHRVPEMFMERFGGSVSHRRDGMHNWQIFGANAAAFLEAARPWIVTKAPEVWLALEFSAHRPEVRRTPLSEEAAAANEGYRLALRQAKKMIGGDFVRVRYD